MLFDEVGLLCTVNEQPPMVTALQSAGFWPEHEEQCCVKVKLTHPDAIAPVEATNGAVLAFDLHSTRVFTIKPGTQEIVSTDLLL